MTPIRVRGKRSGTRGEKWHSGKRRKLDDSKVSRSVPASSSRASSMMPQKAKRRKIQLSGLEQLPTEIVQTIFEYSANVELPLSSPRLSEQLSSKHLHHRIARAILKPVLHCGHKEVAGERERKAATRLLNCRFLTWSFFEDWLEHECESYAFSLPPDSEERAHFRDVPAYARSEDWALNQWRWASLQASGQVLPPTKLLRSPWSGESEQFLRLLSFGVSDITNFDPVYAELASRGFSHAIEQKRRGLVQSFIRMQVPVTQELLRQAVLDDGCEKAIVLDLLRAPLDKDRGNIVGVDQQLRRAGIDILDPLLWSWADRDADAGNEKGNWLKSILRLFLEKRTDDPCTLLINLLFRVS